MNKEFNEENNISEEELTRVSKALNAIENHSNQPTQSEWNQIMEESKPKQGNKLCVQKFYQLLQLLL